MWTLGEKYGALTPRQAAMELIKKLKKYDPFIFKHSMDGLSYYIHFKNLPNAMTHKLRVSNHDERERYGYKWQLRLDGVRNISHHKDMRRYFENIDALVREFDWYYDRVEKLNAELIGELVFTGDPSGQ